MSGLSQVWKSFHPRPATRDEFIAAYLPLCRAFLDSLATGIPNPAPAAYAVEWRGEELDGIAVLAAYAAWWARPMSQQL